MSSTAPVRILLLNQCFYPDVVATAQFAADLAVGLADQGHDVTVVAGRRSYNDSQHRFASKELWGRVRIIRVWSAGLGKGAMWRRAIESASFFLSCVARLAMLRRFDVVVVMTSPPLVCCLAALFVLLRGGRLCLWVMDLNPDQAVAAGWLKADSMVARLLNALLRFSLRLASRVVVLDQFMKDRIRAKGVPDSKISVLPPWSRDASVHYDDRGREEFRNENGLGEKFVVMYAGNHSPCHPLDTLLQAALRLRGESSRISFCFAGGGTEFSKVVRFRDDHGLKNILCLPYQPLSRLSALLSAADLHVVVIGDPFVGIVHPCKIYNVLALEIPILYIGPPSSHAVDLLSNSPRRLRAGQASHGDVDGVVQCILATAEMARELSSSEPETERWDFSQHRLVPEMMTLVTSLRTR